MSRIVHGFHITKKRKHKKTVAFFLLLFLVIIFTIIFYSENSGSFLFTNLLLSLYRLIVAYFISLFVALIVAIFVSNTKMGDYLIPVFDLMQNLPSFALIPFFIAWLGYNNLMTIVFAATSILWPILFYVLHALKSASKDKEDAAKIFGAVGMKKILFFTLPVAFPSIVTGSIVGFSIGWEAIIGVEIIGLSSGIGSFINSTHSGNNTNLILGVSALLVVVFLINRLVWMPLLKKSRIYAE